ncbi:HHHH-motif protein [Burkholderia diffusa]|nr:HHHH-motif protein [Burkholderia diffusa]
MRPIAKILTVAAFITTVLAPTLAEAYPHRACHFDHHHHRICHWVK